MNNIQERSVSIEERIDNAVIEIMEQKHYSKITVTEVAKAAGINRGSFYNYYKDIPDVIEKMTQKLFLRFKLVFSNYYAGNGTYKSFDSARMLDFLKKMSVLGGKNGFEKEFHVEFNQLCSSFFVGFIPECCRNEVDVKPLCDFVTYAVIGSFIINTKEEDVNKNFNALRFSKCIFDGICDIERTQMEEKSYVQN